MIKDKTTSLNDLKIHFFAGSGCGCQQCELQNDSTGDIFDSMDFYLHRLARILPVYYTCFIIGAILIPLGHSYFAPDNLWFNAGGSILSLFLVQTWVMVFGFGPNGPSWTVSTLFFFYLIFPRFDLIHFMEIFDQIH